MDVAREARLLRLRPSQAKPGMVLALPVYHPRNHGTLLIKPGVALDRHAILRLRELNATEVWIRYPRLETVAQYVSPQVHRARAEVSRQIADAFNLASERMHASLDYQRYALSVNTLLDKLSENPRSAMFVGDLVDSGQPAVRHGMNVMYVSLLLGLRLGFYLERERAKLPAPVARDVSNLGVAGMLHDIGMCRLEPAVIERWNRTHDETDEAWREHVRIGYELVRGELEPTAAAAVLHHHQHFDGSGFPRRRTLQGDVVPVAGHDIHVFARIITAADLFDRLTQPGNAPGNTDVGVRARPVVCALADLQTEPYRSWIDPVVFSALIEVCPPYPPGTVVGLSDGREAGVVSWSSARPCRPVVMPLVADGDGFDLDDESAETIDLSKREDLWIARVDGVDVSDANFDSLRRVNLKALATRLAEGGSADQHDTEPASRWDLRAI